MELHRKDRRMQRGYTQRVVWVGIGLAGLLATGCAGPATATKPARPAWADYAQQAPAEPANQLRADAGTNNGSLWRENNSLADMFANAKARRIGDIVTVRIDESSSATNKATTKTKRDSSITAGLTNFFNMEQGYPADRPFFNPFSSVEGGIQSDFEGTGSTIRSGALSAYMTARIVDILPNGNMVIEGNREVRVNHENQIITLTGIVRPRDISANNVVLSTYIADARITYSGSGVVDDRQKPGWLTRIMDKIWPF